jgi:transcriptional regulator
LNVTQTSRGDKKLANYKDHLHGTLDALILRTLASQPRHGYAIATWLREQSGDALRVEDGSLYPALYRMERDGLVDAEWGTTDTGRKAKFYRMTDAGRRHLRVQTKEFAGFVKLVSPILLGA